MNTQSAVIGNVARKGLSDEERKKITIKPDWMDGTGLYGQFPEVIRAGNQHDVDFQLRMTIIENNLRQLFLEPAFMGFFAKPRRLDIGWTINDVLSNQHNPTTGWVIWSINLGDNKNLTLVFTAESEELLVVNAEYQYQNDHTQAFHWYRRHDKNPRGSHALAFDSMRLYEALEVLSSYEDLCTYFRAFIHAWEQVAE